MNNTHVVIMAGGIGSRFWPMSTPEFPKQFIDVMGCGKTLIQLTADRFRNICPMENFWVVTSAHYTGIVRDQLPEIPESHILAEPEARNTAPCIAYACWKIKAENPQANIVVTPSDALVIDVTEFGRVISAALGFTENSDGIVTVGIKPTRPETGYGYIYAPEEPVSQCESLKSVADAVAASADGQDNGKEIIKVNAFKEKPDLETAEKYLADGHYFWNAGIFVWNVNTIMSALRAFTPGLASIMDEMSADFYTDRETATVGRLFPTCEKVSIDYAVMEKSDRIYTIPADFGWSDLGSWGSLRTLLPQDADGNAAVGPDVEMHGCSGCVVHVSDMQRVVLEGLEGFIVAQKGDRLLVCRLSEEQRIKEFSQKKDK